MNDTRDGGDLESVVPEQADVADPQDQDIDFDNLDDAINAIADDDEDTLDEEPETEEDAEDDDQGDDPDDDPEADAEDEESDEDEAFVELPDGETLTLSEIADLRANGLRDADYRRKTAEVARMREEVEQTEARVKERDQYVETALRNIAGFVESMIPAEPDIQLAQTNPAAYTQQKAIREAAIQELNRLTTIGKDVESHKAQASEAEMRAYREREEKALVKAMPHLSDPAKKAAFDKATAEFAAEIGFSPEEIEATADHRVLQLVHYARLGKRAEHNRNNAKRRKVQTPSKGKPKATQSQPDRNRNRERMQRLTKSGAYEDALSIDFD